MFILKGGKRLVFGGLEYEGERYMKKGQKLNSGIRSKLRTTTTIKHIRGYGVELITFCSSKMVW